jgi:hypothetical protein
MEFPLGSEVVRMVGGILAPEPRTKDCLISPGRARETFLLAEAVDELGQLAQALEIEEMRGGRKSSRGVGGVIRGAEGDGGMTAVRQTDDNVGALTVADANDGQWLPTEWMMGMCDGHESQRALG